MSVGKVVIVGSMLVASAGIIYAFYNYVKKELQQAMSFCYKFSNAKIVKAEKSSFIITLTIKIRNQSDIRAKIDNYMFRVFINDKFITTISSLTSVDLLASAVSEIPVKIEFNPQKLFNLAEIIKLTTSALVDQKNFIIRIQGTIAASVNFIKIKDFPIDMKMSLAEIMKPTDPNAINTKLDCKIV